MERATAEARQRALEKAVSQKKLSEPKGQVNEINETTSTMNHINTESALRRKAKLEKHNRFMECAVCFSPLTHNLPTSYSSMSLTCTQCSFFKQKLLQR